MGMENATSCGGGIDGGGRDHGLIDMIEGWRGETMERDATSWERDVTSCVPTL